MQSLVDSRALITRRLVSSPTVSVLTLNPWSRLILWSNPNLVSPAHFAFSVSTCLLQLPVCRGSIFFSLPLLPLWLSLKLLYCHPLCSDECGLNIVLSAGTWALMHTHTLIHDLSPLLVKLAYNRKQMKADLYAQLLVHTHAHNVCKALYAGYIQTAGMAVEGGRMWEGQAINHPVTSLFAIISVSVFSIFISALYFICLLFVSSQSIFHPFSF